MDFQSAIDYLDSCLSMYRQRMNREVDIRKISLLCEALGHPQHRFKSIHVAGTNGKGSTTHALASVLQTAGYKTGLNTSPHLKSLTERMRVNGVPTSKAYVAEFIERHQKLFKKVRPSYFEITIAMAYDFFAQEKVDIAVVEAGLGGRLDATNIITPEVAVITNISFDHMELLGDTLAKIAYEKAGIIKQRVPVVIGRHHPETAPVFEKVANEKNAPLQFASKNYKIQLVDKRNEGLIVSVTKNDTQWPEVLTFNLGGLYQLENIPTVLNTIDVLVEKGLAIHEHQVYKGLKHIQQFTGLRGRWEVLAQRPMVICDVCHNEAGVQHAIQQLKTLDYDHLHIVWGMMKDKETKAVLKLLPRKAHYYFCEADVPRAMPTKKLAKEATDVGLQGKVVGNVKEALQQARNNAGERDVIFVGGSIFVVAEVL